MLPSWKPVSVCAVIAVLFSLSIAACGGSDDDSDGGGGGSAGGGGEKIRIASIMPNVLEGNHYNQVHTNAIRNAIKAVGEDRFEYTMVSKVPYSPQLTQTVQQLFQQGHDVVVDLNVAGDLFFDACRKVPDGKCIGFSAIYDPNGEWPAPNLASFNVDDVPMYYVEGVAAGKLTKTGTVGFVGAFKQPFNTALINAFALGCQSVRPDCKVRNIYINNFYDPPKTVEATTSLLNSGADVIGHFVDDVTPLREAEKRGAKAFGLYTDQQEESPEAWITGVVFEEALTKIWEEELQMLADGTWEPHHNSWGTDSPPNLEFAPWGESIPGDVRQAAEDALEKIRSGENPFKGPIVDASGKVRVPEGEELDLRGEDGGKLELEWTWPVKGVVGL